MIIFPAEKVDAMMKVISVYLAVVGICILFARGAFGEEKTGVPADASAKPAEASKTLEVTGKVRVLRNESDYKLKEINIVCDDGRVYGVLLDQNGRKLAKTLKSMIVRISGEMRADKDKSLLVVHKTEIVGRTKKTEPPAVAVVVSKPEPKPVVKPEEKPEITPPPKADGKPDEKLSDIKTILKPSTNVETVVEVKIEPKIDNQGTGEVRQANARILLPEASGTNAVITNQVPGSAINIETGTPMTNKENSVDSIPADEPGVETGTNAVSQVKSL